jgi:hypothetical protein
MRNRPEGHFWRLPELRRALAPRQVGPHLETVADRVGVPRFPLN